MRPWTVDSLRRYQIGSRKLVRFRTLPWTVNLGREYLPGAFGSGGVPGQWTHGVDVTSGTIGAVGS